MADVAGIERPAGQTARGDGGGVLYLCATPLGNLGDITIRALEVLQQADVILAEDTRRTARLLAHYGIEARLLSFHEHNERTRTRQVLDWLREGKRVVLVSDAGTPGIADPGYFLVRAAAAARIAVTALPGPCALVVGLTLSGLPTHAFIFYGFMPRKDKARHDFLQALEDEERTVVVYETPHRLVRTLEAIVEVLGPGRMLAVARELTKLHEEVVRGSAVEVLERFRRKAPQGEIVLVIGGCGFAGWETEKPSGGPARPQTP